MFNVGIDENSHCRRTLHDVVREGAAREGDGHIIEGVRQDRQAKATHFT